MAKTLGRPRGERRSSAPVPRARCESPKRRLTEERQARGRLSCLTSYDTKTLFRALTEKALQGQSSCPHVSFKVPHRMLRKPSLMDGHMGTGMK